MHWFTRSWWQYLLEGKPSLRRIWCRATGHRGVWFYNPGGLEPDMRCRGCNENIG